MADVFIGHICVTQILWKKKKGFTYLFSSFAIHFLTWKEEKGEPFFLQLIENRFPSKGPNHICKNMRKAKSYHLQALLIGAIYARFRSILSK